jgi:hypothetical protein
MFYFDHLRKLGFLHWRVLLLCAILFFAQVLEAGHASAPDCDEQLCLLCHASNDDEYHSSKLGFSHSSTFTELFLALVSVMLDKTLAVNSPIRAPPQFSL